MNIPLDRTLRAPVPRLPARLDEAMAVALGPSLSAIFFDRPGGRRERMQAEQDGEPVPRPFIAAELGLRSGGTRHVLFVPQGIEAVLARHLLLRLNDLPAAEIDPGWLQAPQGDLATLAAQLSAPGLCRLLRMMLTTGASLFAAEAQAGLAEAALHLMDLCNIPALAPIAKTQVAGRALVSYAAPGLAGLRGPGTAVTIQDGRPVPFKDFDCLFEGTLLHVLLPRGLASAQIVAFADAPLRLGAEGGSLRRQPAAAWLRDRGKDCRDWLSTRVGTDVVATGRRPASGLTEPRIAIRHLSALPSGLLHALVLTDPSRLIRKVILERQGRQAALTPAHGVEGTTILAGLADLPGEMRAGDTCRIRLLYRSGHLRNLAEAPVAAYDGSIPPGFEDAWALGADVLPPLARARAGFRRATPPSVAQHFGPVQKCGLQIVTAIGESADMIRARAAMILAEGKGAPVEVICTMTDGPLAAGARHALAQTAAIYGIPHRLVLLPGVASLAERLRIALAEAQEVPTLLLGADVLPDGRGWLPFWLRRLRQPEALAPALLAGDGSIAATQEGEDPRRGLPATDLPASGRPVRRPLVDCLALGPAGIARLLQAAPHPDPALWIASALGGSARTETRRPFRRFGPVPAPGAFTTALAEAGFALMERDRA
ncbi:hypothetical protein [Paracoccus yeei]|uniref:Uncharacterized protein n=1 Tax=Paracoccus yeei TaxID=147645 RepID=A0A5P2QME9_9RHOB|nr:hypothetical protein [Paracoccus yeei]QEU06649.1 hypothetical protein FOB51_00820 [Paracoccus yeei]